MLEIWHNITFSNVYGVSEQVVFTDGTRFYVGEHTDFADGTSQDIVLPVEFATGEEAVKWYSEGKYC